MINSICAKVISHVCGEYVDHIDSSQLEMEIWNGKAKLENLSISPNAFISHKVPLKVKMGKIGKLSLAFPWNRLSSEPCIVDIENVFVNANITGSVWITSDLEAKQPEELKVDASQQGGMWSGVLNKVIDNLQVNIRNIHIRIEVPTKNSLVAIGISIPYINAISVNESGEPAFLSDMPNYIRKKLSVADFSVYIDTNSHCLEESSFEEMMISEMQRTDHQYILKPFTFDGIIVHSRNPHVAVQNEVTVLTEILDLCLDNDQYKGLVELYIQYQLYNKQRLYSQCGKPDRLPRSPRSSGLWWRYCHKASIVKSQKQVFDVQSAIEILKNRQRYYELWQKHDELEEFEDSLEPSSITFLRIYSEGRAEREMYSFLDENELETITKNVSETNKGPFGLKLSVNSLGVSLLSSKGSPLTKFEINKLNLKYLKTDTESTTDYSLRSASILNFSSQLYPYTMEMIESANQGIKFSILAKPNEPNHITMKVAPIVCIVDVDWIAKLVEFFKIEKMTISNEGEEVSTASKIQIQAVIEKHIFTDFVVEINSPKIIFPYQTAKNCPSIELNLSRFVVRSREGKPFNIEDFSTLYDEFEIQIETGSLVIDKRTVIECLDASILYRAAIAQSTLFDANQVTMKLTPLHANLTTYQFLFIQEFSKYVSYSIPSKSKDKQNKFGSSFNILIPGIHLNLSYDETPLFKASTSCLNIGVKDSAVKVEIEPIRVKELLNGKENDFIHLNDNLVVNVHDDQVKVDINGLELNGYSNCINFIIVYLTKPGSYDWRLGFAPDARLDDIKFNKVSHKEDKDVHVNVTLKNSIGLVQELNSKVKLSEIRVNVLDKGPTNEVEVVLDDILIESNDIGQIVHHKIPIVINAEPISVNVKTSDFNPIATPTFYYNLFGYIDKLTESHGEDKTAPSLFPYISLNIEIDQIHAKIKPENDSNIFIGLNSTLFQFKTIDTPKKHIINIENLAITGNNINVISTELITASLDMDFLLKHLGRKKYSEIMNEIGFEKWKEETDAIINNEKSLKVLGKTDFYMKKLHVILKSNRIELNYSHTEADIIIKMLDYIPQIQKRSKSTSHPLDLLFDLDISSVVFNINHIQQVASFAFGNLDASISANVSINLGNVKSIAFNSTFLESINEKRAFSLKMENKSVQMIFGDLLLYFDPLQIPRIFEFVIFAPFLRLSESKFLKKIYNSKSESSGIDLSLQTGLLQLMVKSNEDYYLSARTSVDFSIKGKMFKTQVNQMQVGIIGQNQVFHQIIEPFDAVFEHTIPYIFNVNISDIRIIFSVCDLVLIIKIAENVNTVLKAIFFPHKEKILSVKQLPEFNVATHAFQVIFCHPHKNIEHKHPFLKFDIEPTKFTFSEEKVILKATPSLSYKNPVTMNWDDVMEKCEVTINTMFNDDLFKLHINFNNSLRYNVQNIFVKELLSYLTTIDLAKVNLDTSNFTNNTLFIENKMGDIILVDDIELMPDEKRVLDHESNIIVEFGDQSVCLSVNDLYYPLCLNPSCIGTIRGENGVRTIVIYSPYAIENQTTIPLEVFITNNESLGIVNPGEKLFYPYNMGSPNKLFFKGVECPYESSHPSYTCDNWHTIIPYTIPLKNGKMLAKIRTHVDHIECMGIVSIAAAYCAMNELPIPVTVNLSAVKQLIHIESGEVFDIMMDSSADEMFLSIQPDDYQVSKTKAIKFGGLKSDNFKFRCFNKNYTQKIYLAVIIEYIPLLSQFKIFIYAPCVVFNTSSADIAIIDSKTNGNKLSFSKIGEDNMAMFGSKKFFRKKQLTAYFTSPETNWNSRVDCLAAGVNSAMFLPYNKSPNVTLPVRYRITSAPYPFKHSSVLTLSPFVTVKNHLDADIIICPMNSNQFETIIKPQEKRQIMSSIEDLSYEVSVRGYEKTWINLSTPVCTIFRLIKYEKGPDLYIELKVVKNHEGFAASFKVPTLPTPIVVANFLSDKSISVFQKREDHPIVISPESTSLFAYDEPFGDCQLIIHIDDNSYPLTLTSDMRPVRIKASPYFYAIKTTNYGHQMIEITSKIYEEKHKNINCMIKLDEFSVSFIDENQRELIYLTISTIYGTIRTQGQINIFDFSVKEIQIDDMMPTAAIPVVLYCKSQPGIPFIKVHSTSEASSPLFLSFNIFEIQVQPLAIEADSNLISDCFVAASYLYRSTIRNKTYKPVLQSKGGKYVGKYFAFNMIKISNISLSLTYSVNTGRIKTLQSTEGLPYYMSFVPGVTNAPLQFAEFSLKYIRTPINFILHSFQDYYTSLAIRQLWRIAGHIDAFGNIFGIAYSFGNGLKNIVVGTVTAGENETLDTLATTSKKMASDTFHQVIQGSESILKTFASLAHRGEQSSSKPKGIIGKFGSLLDKGAEAVSNARKIRTIGKIYNRRRLPEAFPQMRLIQFNAVESCIQYNLQMKVNKWDQRLLLIVNNQKNKHIFALFDDYVAVSVKFGDLIHHAKIIYLNDLNVKMESLSFSIREEDSNYPYSFICDSEAQAMNIYLMLMSKRIMMTIFE